MSEIHASYDFTSAAIKYGLDMDKLTSDLALPSLNLSEAAAEIQYIGHRAYKSAEWVQKLTDGTSASVTGIFNPHDPEKVATQAERLATAKQSGKRVEYWAASASLPGDLDSPPAPHGFVKVEQQGWRNNVFSRAAQKVGFAGVYACVHDLNVLPEFQGWGIGTALAHNALLQQPQNMKSSLYTAAANSPMVAWATKYGYRISDEYEETTMFESRPVPFVRMQAESVGQVIQHMERARPELQTRIPRTASEALLRRWCRVKGPTT